MRRIEQLLLPLLTTALLAGSGCATDRRLERDEETSSVPPALVPLNPPAIGQDGHDHSRGDSKAKKAASESGNKLERGSSIVSIGPLVLRAAFSHSAYSMAVPRRLILKLHLSATSKKPITRKPLNIALVFDRSGSMAEQKKFEYAMKAAMMVVENLSDRDVISLIVFGDRAIVLSPAGKAVNKDYLYHRLTEFEPEGNTNLSAGMLEAFAQIDSKSAEGQHKQVIVLTDGLANRGVTDPLELSAMVAKARKRGIHLSTIGCGTEFDGKLLTDIAIAGAGRYTYVGDAEEIPAAVSAELNGLLEVVAQNVKLEIRASPDSSITQLSGRLPTAPVPSHTIDVGDMRNTESGIMLVEVEPGARKAGATVEVVIGLTFDDPRSGTRTKREIRVRAEFFAEAKRVRESENKAVLLYARVLDAMEKAEEAIEGLDTDRFASLRASFDRIHEETRLYAIASRDQVLLNHAFLLQHYMAELWAASDSALLHGHDEAKKRLKKDIEYRRYLLRHHREHR